MKPSIIDMSLADWRTRWLTTGWIETHLSETTTCSRIKTLNWREPNEWIFVKAVQEIGIGCLSNLKPRDRRRLARNGFVSSSEQIVTTTDTYVCACVYALIWNRWLTFWRPRSGVQTWNEWMPSGPNEQQIGEDLVGGWSERRPNQLNSFFSFSYANLACLSDLQTKRMRKRRLCEEWRMVWNNQNNLNRKTLGLIAAILYSNNNNNNKTSNKKPD